MTDSPVLDRLRHRSHWQRRSLAFVAGVLATLALPPVYAVPLLLFSLPVLLLLGLTSRSKAAAFAEGWWFGFGHFLTGLYWIGIAFVVNEDVSDWGGVFAAGLLGGIFAVFPGFVALGLQLFSRLPAPAGRPAALLACALAFTVLWCLTEWLRGHLFTGFPWNLLGTVWAFSPAMMQSTALWGLYGLSLVTVLMAVLPVTLLQPVRGWRRLAPTAVAVLLLAGLWGGGAARLAGASDAVVEGIRIRIVQANVSQADKWRRDRLSENFIRHLELSAKRGNKPVTHIIWPETAVPYFLNDEPSRRFLIADVVPPGGYVLAGAPKLEQDENGDPTIANSLFVIDGEARIQASYDKTHLVPFGEYLPFRGLLSLIGLDRFVPSALDFTPGPGLRLLDLPGLPSFSPLICYEIIFPGKVVPESERPHWLLNLTNDAWYGRSSGPYQHLVTAQFRAVEEGLPVVRAAGTGISAIIDAYGRIRQYKPLGQGGFIDGDLPQRVEEPTLFARAGDWSYFGLLVILVLLARRLSRR